MRYLFVTLVLAVVITGCNQPEVRNDPKPYKPPVVVEPEFENEFDRLVWLLGVSNFDKRAEAYNKLYLMGKEIIPFLEEASEKVESEDHRHQIKLLIDDLTEYKDPAERKDILVKLEISKKAFKPMEPVEVTVTIKNTGNVPLKLTAPLLRKRSIAFRLDWIADMTFMSGGVEQQMEARGVKRDEWLTEGWNPTEITVEPGKSISEKIDITDISSRPSRYTATATYRWIGVEDFTSNAVSFEREKPPKQEEEPQEDGDK